MGVLATLMILATLASAGPAKLMDWPDLVSRPAPHPTDRIPYGAGPLAFGELWLPAGAGPFPTVLMIHGGCWRSSVARLSIMNYAAEDLRRRGFAVWNIEYRGVDRPGGGYPGTFEDVLAAAGELRALARRHLLDLGRVVAIGHSAGGHLALWLAAYRRLGASSPLAGRDPPRIAAVLSLGGLPDLEAELARGDESCGASTIQALIGRASPERPNVYADTSPAQLDAGDADEVLINGVEDGLAPPGLAQAYAAKMWARGARIRSVAVAATGHVELIAPGTPAWAETVRRLEALARSER